MQYRREPCPACSATPQYRAACRECGAKGYVEARTAEPGCTQQASECPVEFEPAVGGWLCRKCGASGPL